MEKRIYGYARVSSADQNEARQIQSLLEFGVSRRNIKIDKQSGKDFNRRAYLSLVGTDDTEPELREGDLLVVCSIDRLGRDYTEIMAQWRHITQTLEADIKVLDMPLLNTSKREKNLDGKFIADLVLQILSYVAQKERENIHKRQKQGIEIARTNGTRFGRPPVDYPANWESVYLQWQARVLSAVTAMQTLGLKRSSFYKLARQYSENSEKL